MMKSKINVEVILDLFDLWCRWINKIIINQCIKQRTAAVSNMADRPSKGSPQPPGRRPAAQNSGTQSGLLYEQVYSWIERRKFQTKCSRNIASVRKALIVNKIMVMRTGVSGKICHSTIQNTRSSSPIAIFSRKAYTVRQPQQQQQPASKLWLLAG